MINRLLLAWLVLECASGGKASPPARSMPAMELSRAAITTSPVPRGFHLVDAQEGSIAPDAPVDRSELSQQLRQEGIHLIAVRHGQSEVNAQAEKEGVRILCGQTETPLSPTGRQQAEAAAQKVYAQLGGEAWLEQAAGNPRLLPVIYSGPLSRAQDTAQATVSYIAGKATELAQHGRISPAKAERVSHDLAPHVDPRLTEINFGDCDLHRVSDVVRELPEFMSHYDREAGQGVDFLHRFPHGESRADVMTRVDSFLHDVASHDAGRTVVMFCHMVTMAAVEEELGLMPLKDGRMHEDAHNLTNAAPIDLSNR